SDDGDEVEDGAEDTPELGSLVGRAVVDERGNERAADGAANEQIKELLGQFQRGKERARLFALPKQTANDLQAHHTQQTAEEIAQHNQGGCCDQPVMCSRARRRGLNGFGLVARDEVAFHAYSSARLPCCKMRSISAVVEWPGT